MRKSEEEISFYYWYCHTIKTGSRNKPVGIFQITLSCQGRKKAINEREIKKNKSTSIKNPVKNIIMACHLWWEWKFTAVEFSSASANISKSAARYYLLDCFIWIKLTLKFQKECSHLHFSFKVWQFWVTFSFSPILSTLPEMRG